MTETPVADQPAAEPHAFQADVARLLHLMVHSIYSEREIFLRELISNAADACEKLRYEALSNAGLVADEAPFAISLMLDKEAGTLTVTDNGIGMNRAELIGALGTIASSGTRAFLEKIGRSEDVEDHEEDGGKGASAADLIGQFGIGFYSAFMVADRVVVETRRAGIDEAFRWSSNGKGTYEIEPLPIKTAPRRGTRVILHLNSESTEFLESWRVEQIVREHSGAVPIPIELQDSPTSEAKKLTDGAAVWAKPRNAITESEYTEFYRGLSGQFDEPAMTIHWRAEGRHEYTVLAFVPGSRPFDLFDPERKARTKLYVRRVLISQDGDLLPGWLRFVRLVVDSGDLPLNVSREMIQSSPVYAAIKRGLVNRIIQELTKVAETESDKFAKIWDAFGPVLKEGLYEDPERRDQLFKLARFASTKSGDTPRTLAQYVGDLRPNQTAIYYITGEDQKRLAASPQLEGYRTRGVEVLLLSDPVDAFWVQTALGFDGKPFKSVTQGGADLKLIPVADGEQAASSETSPDVAALLAFFKQTLADSIEDVRASDRLLESPACLVAPENGPDRRLEKILVQHGRLSSVSKPVLEVNPNHALISGLAKRFKEDGDRSLIEDAAWLLHDEARLMDGDTLADPAAFAARLTRVLTRASA